MVSYPNVAYPYPYGEEPVHGGKPEVGNHVGYVIKKSGGQIIEVEADSYELSDGEFRFRSGSRLVRTIPRADVVEVYEKADQP